MPSPKQNHIVADGRERILSGSGRVHAARLQAHLMRRAAPLLERANFIGRFVIRYRMGRFVQRRVAEHAPFEAFYSKHDLRIASSESPCSDVSHAATLPPRNQLPPSTYSAAQHL